MKKINQLFLLLLLITTAACTQQPSNYTGQYPDNVREILVNKCATAGCHNATSYEGAGGLRLDTWDALFSGAANGAVAIPYSAANSSMLYFINTDPTKGPVLTPQMPLNNAPLSATEYNIIQNWIAAGAPDKTGAIPYGTDAQGRQKYYVTQQGCDLIAVVDAATGNIMRYIKVGMIDESIEVPHCVRFTSDGRYAYVSFTKGQYLQKIDVNTDAVVANMFLGTGGWNLFRISPDDKNMVICDFDNGVIQYIDLQTMAIARTFYGDFTNPHGVESNPAFDTFFVTSQYGNVVYQLTFKSPPKSITLDGKEATNSNSSYNPHEIIMAPDHSRYFVTCQNSNEVRVMDAHTNQLIKAIPVGAFPQEFAMAHTQPYLFVSCEEDVTAAYPKFKGTVYVINYNTLEIVTSIQGPFYQIHGIALDEQRNHLIIVSRNLEIAGPAPHHTSECGGRDGYYNIYDMTTFQPVDGRRYESSVDPYSADIRFKGAVSSK